MSSLLLTLTLATSVVSAAAVTDVVDERVAPALVALHTAGAGSFDVIVHLEAPPEALLPLSPRGVEQPAARLEAVHVTLTQGIGELYDRVPPADLTLRRVLRLRPAFAATVTRAGLEALAAAPGVRFVEEDVVWHAHTTQGLPMIGADVLHSLGYDGSGFAVAIIDTGVDATHPTLGGGPIPNSKVVYGLDTADLDSDPSDCDGHGTAVASIAAGSPYTWTTSTFAGGVAPGAQILAYKASGNADCGSFSSSAVTAAIDDAILKRDTYNLVAINLSIGGGFFNGPCDSRNASYANAMDDATEAGIAVVVSSGNEAQKDRLASPACVSNAISVGAVYDTDPGRYYSYCGTTCAEILCTDTSPEPGQVTCYSNSNRYLDVFAPSEELTAARRSGIMTDFGGTSGAAPYVTGAMALIFDAFPGIDPVQARFLLELTGSPITDAANGVTRPLVRLDQALARSSVALGAESFVAIPNATGSPAVATAYVDQDGYVDAVRVLLKIVHGDPDHLRITLVSPDGTRAMLHDHGPGTTPDGTSDASLGTNGVYAYYPDDIEPVEGFGRFTNLTARGTWRLEILDDESFQRVNVTQRLIGWALDVATRTAPEPPSASSFFIPVGVHSFGAGSTFWVTDTRVLNPSFTAGADVSLYLVPKGADGTTTFQRTNLTIPPRTILSLPDVLAERFGQTNLQGNLIFQTEAVDLVATSRTYNTGGGDGTYGQFVGMAHAAAAIGVGDPALVMPQLANNAGYRTNLGFSEMAGGTATVTVTLFDGATGSVLGTPDSYTLYPFSNHQVNLVFDQLGAGTSSNAYATVAVTAGSGRATAYASVIDNRTGDAIYIPGRTPVAATAHIVPIVAKISGQANTNWVSDVRVYNPGASSVSVDLEMRPQQGTAGSFATVAAAVGPRSVLALDDVLANRFGLSSGSGSLRIVPRGGATPLLVTSRTYNSTDDGTYGQFIGAVTTGLGASVTGTVLHLDKSSSFRSNFGVCEVAGGTAQIRYVLKDGSGSTLGAGDMSLGPFEVRQINDVFAAVGAAGVENARVDVFLDGGSGAFAAYGSVIDNRSGDAIYIPASGF